MTKSKCLLAPIAGLLDFMCDNNTGEVFYCDVACRVFNGRIDMAIQDYIHRLCRYSECSKEVICYMFLLLGNATMNKLTITHRNVHKLVLTSFVISCKLRDDNYKSNAFYAEVGGVSLETLNEMELLFLDTLLKWELAVLRSDVDLLISRVELTYSKIRLSHLKKDSKQTREQQSLLKQNEIPVETVPSV